MTHAVAKQIPCRERNSLNAAAPDRAAMREAAHNLLANGPRAVLLKGGHATDDNHRPQRKRRGRDRHGVGMRPEVRIAVVIEIAIWPVLALI